ncbi:hypothetical protein ACWENQ_45755 [Nonomuraea sp. NPDC004354]
MVAYSLVIIWYACHAHHAADVVAEHRRCAPWYRTKGPPSFDDMLALLRMIIASRSSATRPAQPDLAKIEDKALALACATG